MEANSLIEITKKTIDEVDRLLRLPTSVYIKEFGCEADRAHYAKIEKVTNMVTTLNFFIDQYYMQHPEVKLEMPAVEKSVENPEKEFVPGTVVEKKADVTPLVE